VQSALKEFEEQGVSIVVISFADPERLSHYQGVHAWPFTLLAPNNAAQTIGSFQNCHLDLKILVETFLEEIISGG